MWIDLISKNVIEIEGAESIQAVINALPNLIAGGSLLAFGVERAPEEALLWFASKNQSINIVDFSTWVKGDNCRACFTIRADSDYVEFLSKLAKNHPYCICHIVGYSPGYPIFYYHDACDAPLSLMYISDGISETDVSDFSLAVKATSRIIPSPLL